MPPRHEMNGWPARLLDRKSDSKEGAWNDSVVATCQQVTIRDMFETNKLLMQSLREGS